MSIELTNFKKQISHFPITTVLVPQGAEYKAVLKGLRQAAKTTSQSDLPRLISLPIGPQSVYQALETRQGSNGLTVDSTVLLMGLGGSLTTEFEVGAITVLETCIANWGDEMKCLESDRSLCEWVQNTPNTNIRKVKGVTSDRLISSVAEKRQLNRRFDAVIVDMEGYTVLQWCHEQRMRGGVLRVVSDDCSHDVPDINDAIDMEGKLKPLPLAMNLIRQPRAAVHLIRGSMAGLNVLSQVTYQMFCRNFNTPHQK